MGTGTLMRRLLLIILLCTTAALPQAGFVPAEHPVHNFLSRMFRQGVTNEMPPFELPVTRRAVAGALAAVEAAIAQLTDQERAELRVYTKEFEWDLTRTSEMQSGMVGGNTAGYYEPRRDRYFYQYADAENWFSFNFLIASGIASQKADAAALLKAGGEMRAELGSGFGFQITGTNGVFNGSRAAAFTRPEIASNFKAAENGSGTFFDESRGGVGYADEHVALRVAKDALTVGSPFFPIIGANQGPLNLLQFTLRYNVFDFAFYHGSILGDSLRIADPVGGTDKQITDKYLVYHRFGFRFHQNFRIGIGEVVVYGGRAPDLAYLNPFNFFKPAEHANQDRDNTMLFGDFSWRLPYNTMLTGTLLLDDFDFGRIGEKWYGNQMMLTLGMASSGTILGMPLELSSGFVHIDPYVFTHRLSRNKFTDNGLPLGTELPPNSRAAAMELNYRPYCNLLVSLSFMYGIHGANEVAPSGMLLRNVGGDVNAGHRINDPVSVSFLDGVKTIYRSFTARLAYEPWRRVNAVLAINKTNLPAGYVVANNQLRVYLGFCVLF